MTAQDVPPPFAIQVDPSHYGWAGYHTRERWSSFWHQIDEVVATGGRSCLEIGVGSGIVTHALRSFGIAVTTVDIEPALGIDRVGDVRALPCSDREFDVVMCCQVLEHLPWADVPGAVAELGRVAADAIVVSLPQSGRPIRLELGLPTRQTLRWAESVSRRRPVPPPNNEQHHWQVGSTGSGRKQVRRALQGDGAFELTREYVVPSNPYHRFYVLRRLPR